MWSNFYRSHILSIYPSFISLSTACLTNRSFTLYRRGMTLKLLTILLSLLSLLSYFFLLVRPGPQENPCWFFGSTDNPGMEFLPFSFLFGLVQIVQVERGWEFERLVILLFGGDRSQGSPAYTDGVFSIIISGSSVDESVGSRRIENMGVFDHFVLNYLLFRAICAPQTKKGQKEQEQEQPKRRSS